MRDGAETYVRELVGRDGRVLADFWFEILQDECEEMMNRMAAASWLTEQGGFLRRTENAATHSPPVETQ